MDNIFDSFFKTANKNFEYVAAGLCLDLAKNIEILMTQQNLSNVELAEKLGCSKSYVTKLLRGDENLSIKTLAKIAIALDAEINAVFIPKVAYEEISRRVRDYFQQQNRQHQAATHKAWLQSSTKCCNDESYDKKHTLTGYEYAPNRAA